MEYVLDKEFRLYDVDKKEINTGFRHIARILKKNTKKQLSKRQISKGGQAPGLRTGTLKRSIRHRIKHYSDYSVVRVGPTMISGMNVFYPAFLIYGTSRGLEARKNVMQVAQKQESRKVFKILGDAVERSLKPRLLR